MPQPSNADVYNFLREHLELEFESTEHVSTSNPAQNYVNLKVKLVFVDGGERTTITETFWSPDLLVLS